MTSAVTLITCVIVLFIKQVFICAKQTLNGGIPLLLNNGMNGNSKANVKLIKSELSPN